MPLLSRAKHVSRCMCCVLWRARVCVFVDMGLARISFWKNNRKAREKKNQHTHQFIRLCGVYAIHISNRQERLFPLDEKSKFIHLLAASTHFHSDCHISWNQLFTPNASAKINSIRSYSFLVSFIIRLKPFSLSLSPKNQHHQHITKGHAA